MGVWFAAFTKWFAAASTAMKIAVIGAITVASAGVVAIPISIANNSEVLTVQSSGTANKENSTREQSKTLTPRNSATQTPSSTETNSPSPSASKSSNKNTARVPSAPRNPRFNQGGCGDGYCGAAITVDVPSDTGSSAITGYEVGYSTDGGSNFTWVAFGNTPDYMMVDPMPASTSYDIIVRAKNAAGTGPNSTMFRLPLTVQLVPSPPTGLAMGGRGCGSGDNGITISCGGDIIYTAPQNPGVGPYTYMSGYSTNGGASWSFSVASPGQQDSANLYFETQTFPINEVPNLLVGVKIVNAYGESPIATVPFQ